MELFQSTSFIQYYPTILTINTRYFKEMLNTFSSPPIYSKYVKLPCADDPIPPTIHNNPKFYPFFEGAIGAINGTHIACTPSADERDACRNRKGFTSQIVLFVVTLKWTLPMYSVDGKGQWPMWLFTMMHRCPILLSLQACITLLMRGFQVACSCYCCTVGNDNTWPSWAVHKLSVYFFSFLFFSLTKIC